MSTENHHLNSFQMEPDESIKGGIPKLPDSPVRTAESAAAAPFTPPASKHQSPNTKWDVYSTPKRGATSAATSAIPQPLPVPPFLHSFPVSAALENTQWTFHLNKLPPTPSSRMQRLLRVAGACEVSVQNLVMGNEDQQAEKWFRRRMALPKDNLVQVFGGETPLSTPSSLKESKRCCASGGGERTAVCSGDFQEILGGRDSGVQRQGQALYWLALEHIIAHSSPSFISTTPSEPAPAVGKDEEAAITLLADGALHCSLLACCMEIVLAAHSLVPTFPRIIQLFDCSALDFFKVIGLFVSAVILPQHRNTPQDAAGTLLPPPLPPFPPSLRRHLLKIQESILEQHAWDYRISPLGAMIVRATAEGAWPVPPLRCSAASQEKTAAVAGAPANDSDRRKSKSMTTTTTTTTPATTEASIETKIRARTSTAFEDVAGHNHRRCDGEKAKDDYGTVLTLFFEKLLALCRRHIDELSEAIVEVTGGVGEKRGASSEEAEKRKHNLKQRVYALLVLCLRDRSSALLTHGRSVLHLIFCSFYFVGRAVPFASIPSRDSCGVADAGPAGALVGEAYIEGERNRGGASISFGAIIESACLLLHSNKSFFMDIPLKNEQKRGGIIDFYNSIFVPNMKAHTKEMEELKITPFIGVKKKKRAAIMLSNQPLGRIFVDTAGSSMCSALRRTMLKPVSETATMALPYTFGESLPIDLSLANRSVQNQLLRRSYSLVNRSVQNQLLQRNYSNTVTKEEVAISDVV
mmetsp:Transcript_79850/g.159456  ORF Transcript_79850/g.159456 Transcript_79850/m.159456 type:complete len:750 (-) Transcript_79850:142-2391(-)